MAATGNSCFWLVDLRKKNFSSETAWSNEPKFGRKHSRNVIYKDWSFRPDPLKTWPPQAIVVSDWLNSKIYSPLKPLGIINRKLAGSIYGRSSMHNAHFVPTQWQTWRPQAILVSDLSISKKSSPLKPFGQMNRNLIRSMYGRCYKDCQFRPDALLNMAAIRQFFFVIGQFRKNLQLWNRLAKWTETW